MRTLSGRLHLGMEAALVAIIIVLLLTRSDRNCGGSGVAVTGIGTGSPIARASVSSGAPVPVGDGPDAPSPAASRPSSGRTACDVITTGDVTAIIGRPVGEPESTGSKPDSNMCTWDPGAGLVLVQVVPPEFWEPHHAAGYRELDGIARKAYVERNLAGDGYVAGALLDDRAITADVGGPESTPEQAIALVTLAVERLV